MKFPTLIILSGGSSSRFAPLKEKMLFKFLGSTLVEHQLKTFKRHGFEKIVIVTSENNFDEIKNEATRVTPNLEIVIQKGEGMAGAANTALEKIGDDESVLIVNMNDIFDDGIFEKLKAHLGTNPSENLFVGFYSEKYFPGGYFTLDGDRVVGIVEKPGEGNEPSKIVNMVFDYFPNAAVLKKYMAEAASDRDDVYEVAVDKMMKDGIVFKYAEHKGIWRTIKYPWHVLSMMEYYLSVIGGQEISSKAEIAKSAKIIGHVVIEEGVKIFDNAVIKGPVYIGKNSIIANNALVRDSMVGDNCVIGFSTEIARSYISESCWFHTNYIGDSVLGKNVSLGSGAVTANLRLDEQEVKVNVKGERVGTGLIKFGNVMVIMSGLA